MRSTKNKTKKKKKETKENLYSAHLPLPGPVETYIHTGLEDQKLFYGYLFYFTDQGAPHDEEG